MDSKRSALNFITSTIPTFLVGILNMVRVGVFIRYFGADFNGMYQLFFQFVTYLGLIEAGIEVALISNLFKPLHDKNLTYVSSIVNGARRLWKWVGVGMILAGAALAPFLSVFIADNPFSVVFTALVFMIIVTRFANSYFWAGPQTVLDAENRVYIVNNWRTAQQIVVAGTSIILAIVTRNFLLVVSVETIIYMAFTIMQYFHTKGYFPWLDYKAPRAYTFAKDAVGSSLIRFSDAVINNTDNIVISSLLGLGAVSIMTAYASILGTVTNIFSLSIMQAVQAAYGKLNASDNKEALATNFGIMKVIMFFLGAMLVPILFVIIQPFILLAFTAETLATLGFLAAFLFLMYLRIVRAPFLTLRVSLGLYNKLFAPAIVNAVLNIIFSVSLTIIFNNPIGVICGTIISFLLTEFWFEVMIIDVNKMHNKKYQYFLVFFVNTVWTVALSVGFWFIFGSIEVNSIMTWFLLAMAAGLLSLGLNTIVYYIVSKKFRDLIKLGINMVKKLVAHRSSKK